MKYFIDTEFLEGTQTKRVLGFNVGQTKPTIDLISICIVAEDGREYYAISKEFNLKEAWNRCQKKDRQPTGIEYIYWFRENVLKPIFITLGRWDVHDTTFNLPFTFYNLKRLIKRYGKTNTQIAEEVKEFVSIKSACLSKLKDVQNGIVHPSSVFPEFYGYYADYDWVAFCWLFGKMIDLPQGFPMYCNDLKQIMNEKVSRLETYQISKIVFPDGAFCFTNDADGNLSVQLDRIKTSPNYPKQTNEHNALADARWNKKLYEFLKTL